MSNKLCDKKLNFNIRSPLVLESILVFLLFSFLIHGQWKTLNPVPAGNTLNDVFFKDSHLGWAVGDDGIILKSIDSGVSWFPVISNSMQNLNKVVFINDDEGFAIGQNGTILKSTNRGRDWLTENFINSKNLTAADFRSEGNGFVATGDGHIYKKSLYGIGWSEVSNTQLESFADIQIVTNNFTVAAGKGILISTDAGNNWSLPDSIYYSDIISNERIFYSIHMLDSSTGYVCGDFATVLKTTDGGVNWYQLQTGFLTPTYKSIKFSDDQNGIIVGEKEGDGFIIRTTNGGSTWQPYIDVKNLLSVKDRNSDYYHFELNSISYLDQNTFVAVGKDGTIIRTEDNGGNWFNLYSGTNDYIKEIFFIDAMNGWAAGGFYAFSAPSGVAKIYKTTNGGETWVSTYKSPGIANELFFLNNDVGFALLFNLDNILLKTTDAGFTWTSLQMPSFPIIQSIFFVDEQIGWASGEYGYLFKTTDSGNSWNQVNTGYTNTFRKIIFSDEQTGYICGDNGTILKTTDSGNNWIDTYPLAQGNFRDIFFIGDNIWAAGQRDNLPLSNGIISMTIDGGISWSNYESLNAVNSISFDDELTGIAVGENGQILHSLNGGADWYQDQINLSSELTSVNYNITGVAYAGGYDGLILAYKGFNGWTSNINITFEDHASNNTSLTFGQHEDATIDLDVNIGEKSLLPLVPGNIDGRFILPDPFLHETKLDLRDTSACSIDWNIKIQSNGSEKVRLNWNPESLPDGSFIIRSSGQKFDPFDMKEFEELQFDSTEVLELVIEYRKMLTSSIAMNNGWNLISVPLLTESMRFDSIFPQSLSQPISFNNGYLPDTLLQNGRGYWLKYDSQTLLDISGIQVALPIEIQNGWNLIGPFEQSVSVNNLQTEPEGIITGSLFGFDNGYFIADQLQPGRGYWLKASGGGILKFSDGINNKLNSNSFVLENSHGIIFTDSKGSKARILITDSDEIIENSSLPPIPPQGILDVRSEDDRFAVSKLSDSFVLKIRTDNYPVSIRSEGVDFLVSDLWGGELLSKSLQNGNEFTIDLPLNALLFKVTSESQNPTEYRLYQNYPNPFNPVTKIKFSIPLNSESYGYAAVSIKVYDLLGQEVLTLINEKIEPGIHEIEFDGSGMPSGIYYYRLTSGSFSDTKKFILLK